MSKDLTGTQTVIILVIMFFVFLFGLRMISYLQNPGECMVVECYDDGVLIYNYTYIRPSFYRYVFWVGGDPSPDYYPQSYFVDGSRVICESIIKSRKCRV